MTEKRFTMDDESDIIEFDWNTNEYIDDFMWGDGKSWDRVCNRLNELYEENKQLKADNNRLVNETAKVVAEHQRKVLELIDEKIKHYQKQPHLAVRISTNCEHRKSCLHNQEVNVCNKAKENAYRELKKELQE